MCCFALELVLYTSSVKHVYADMYICVNIYVYICIDDDCIATTSRPHRHMYTYIRQLYIDDHELHNYRAVQDLAL